MKKIIFILSFFTMACTEKEEGLKKEAFVENWIITNVDCDGNYKAEWLDLELQFEQIVEKSGTYKLVNSVHDTILPSVGVWSITNRANELLLNDSVLVEYYINEDVLTMEMVLGWTSTPCLDTVCVLGLIGYWAFEFEKRNP